MSTSLARCRLEFILGPYSSLDLNTFAARSHQCLVNYPSFLGTCRFVPSRKGGGQLLARLITARAQKSQVDHSHCFQPTELSNYNRLQLLSDLRSPSCGNTAKAHIASDYAMMRILIRSSFLPPSFSGPSSI